VALKTSPPTVVGSQTKEPALKVKTCPSVAPISSMMAPVTELSCSMKVTVKEAAPWASSITRLSTAPMAMLMTLSPLAMRIFEVCNSMAKDSLNDPPSVNPTAVTKSKLVPAMSSWLLLIDTLETLGLAAGVAVASGVVEPCAEISSESSPGSGVHEIKLNNAIKSNSIFIFIAPPNLSLYFNLALCIETIFS